MPFLVTLTAAVGFLSVVGANPVDIRKRSTFSVEQVERNKVLRNGAASKARTIRKYGRLVPDNIIKAAAAGPTGTVEANPEDAYDSAYLSPITVGNATLNVDFDTGSADLWVYSSLQPSSQRAGHDYYIAESSKKVQGASWKISYGDGSGAAGAVYADKVVVGGVTATKQTVEAATSISAQFQQDKDNDGLLGLAFSSINTVKPEAAKTFFDTVKDDLAEPVFSVALKYHAPGTYDFGFIDNAKYTGDITYVDVNTGQGFWEITADGYAVGSGSTVTSSIDAIADTGTTLAYLPTAVVEAYYKEVGGAKDDQSAGGYVFDCNTDLPEFSVVIAGTKQTIPGKYINYAPVEEGSSTCYGGIQDNTGIGLSILGDIFLKSKYVIHESKSSGARLGFAEQASS